MAFLEIPSLAADENKFSPVGSLGIISAVMALEIPSLATDAHLRWTSVGSLGIIKSLILRLFGFIEIKLRCPIITIFYIVAINCTSSYCKNDNERDEDNSYKRCVNILIKPKIC